MRPVSFRYKSNTESKYSRFGFVAQELEGLLPSVVHSDMETGFKYVLHTDVLAVLTLGLQVLETTANQTENDISALGSKVDKDFDFLNPLVETYEKTLLEFITEHVGQNTRLFYEKTSGDPVAYGTNSTAAIVPNTKYSNSAWSEQSVEEDTISLLSELHYLANTE